MSIYGKTKGGSRSNMSLVDLINAGVHVDALKKRALQVNNAEGAHRLCVAKCNEAASLKELQQTCKRLIKATVQLEYMKELIRIEPVAGPLYRIEEIKARFAAWRHAQNQREEIDSSIRYACAGRALRQMEKWEKESDPFSKAGGIWARLKLFFRRRQWSKE